MFLLTFLHASTNFLLCLESTLLVLNELAQKSNYIELSRECINPPPYIQEQKLDYIYIYIYIFLKTLHMQRKMPSCRSIYMPINAKTIFEDERKLTQRRNKLRQLVNQNKLTVAILKINK